jgi:hypothetical protein
VKTRLANPIGLTTAKWTAWSAQSSLARRMVNAVERAQQPPDGGEVKVSCHPKEQHRVGVLHGQAQRLSP